MNKKIEEYSKFKGELNQQLSTFTAIDFNKMREIENNEANKPKEQQENNKTDKPEEQQENNKTEKPEKQPENNKTNESEEEYEDIYSNSQDSVKAIHIEAATGKAYVDTFKNNKKR